MPYPVTTIIETLYTSFYVLVKSNLYWFLADRKRNTGLLLNSLFLRVWREKVVMGDWKQN